MGGLPLQMSTKVWEARYDRLGAQMLIMVTTELISYAANVVDVVES